MERTMFVRDRGKPAHVLLSIEEHRRIASGRQKIADPLAMLGVEDIDLDIPRFDTPAQAADLS